jgi:hypothetical protein
VKPLNRHSMILLLVLEWMMGNSQAKKPSRKLFTLVGVSIFIHIDYQMKTHLMDGIGLKKGRYKMKEESYLFIIK